MATETLVFVSETCGGAHIGRRRACGVCSIQKKKCVRIPENPLLCENCKKRNLKTCPPPSNQKGKLAVYLALIGQQANVDETVATDPPASRTRSRRLDEADHSNERTLVPPSYTVSGHQTSYSSAIASVTENAADTNQKGFVGYVNVLPDISYSQSFTGPICNVHAHNTAEESPVSYTDDSQQTNLRNDFTAAGAYVQGTYSRDVPLDCSGDDLSQALHQLYQMDYETYISPQTPSLAPPFTGHITFNTDVNISPNYTVDRTCANVVGHGNYYDMWLQTEPPYPSYSLGNTGENYGNSHHQASLVSGTPAVHDMRLNSEIDDSYEEVVQMLRNIQWFPD